MRARPRTPASITLGGAHADRRLLTPLRALIRATLALEGRTPGEIAIVIEDDATLREINRRWRGIDRATDVISFAYDEGARPAPASGRAALAVNGDLVLSIDRVRAQSVRFRVSEGAELARLVIHGTLHLAGFDHQRAGERRMMREKEEAALSSGRHIIEVLERRFSALFS